MAGLVVTAVLVPALVAAGLAIALRRARRRHETAMGERGWLLERERESAARAAVDAERARIARELHDIVSHNVSVMIVQTAAAREVLRTMPDEALTALAAVEKAGRDTMSELRTLLGLLNPDAGGDDLTPQPTLDALGPLVDRIAFAGMPVEVRISGEARPLPSGISATAYRIVQEALTNALRHGSGGKAEVTIRYAERALRVEVLTTGPSVLTGPAPANENAPAEREAPPEGDSPAGGNAAGRPPAGARGGEGAGRGLLGLRERVAVYGGDLDARRRLGGGFRVRARIPHE
ncbi:sensor histidine kinase [Actinoplanes missouriensis]|uniref:sensor histidine kinase n=1 Tax=Actinoplanes missouriensis TaxID=1866 RepID=UPI003F4D694F